MIFARAGSALVAFQFWPRPSSPLLPKHPLRLSTRDQASRVRRGQRGVVKTFATAGR